MIVVVLLWSCRKNEKTYLFMPNSGFLQKPGIYTSKSVIIFIKRYDDGSLTYGITDKKYKIIYQHPVFSSFNDNLYWFLYKDKEENVWFYSSDIQESKVYVRDSLTDRYTEHDFCKEKIKLPKVIQKNTNYCL